VAMVASGGTRSRSVREREAARLRARGKMGVARVWTRGDGGG
jgi:hypothetical protein